MSDLIVLGTDTDAGKTTFALIWLAAFGDAYGYWKPVETGPSDTRLVRQMAPGANICEPVSRFADPVAPALAARREGRTVPSAAAIAAARPRTGQPLLIETFGGPLSPLNETELQLELIRQLGDACVLVTSSKVGAVGRALTAVQTLRAERIPIQAVVLVGPRDEYAEEEICKHGRILTRSLRPPATWELASLKSAATEQRAVLEELRHVVDEDVRESGAAPADLVDRDRQHVWHPYTSLRDPTQPLSVVGAHDEFLELADGHRLIDGISSWWTILHGHRKARLMAALLRASERIDHVLFAGATHEFAVEYAEELLETAPWSGSRVFYSDNGSTAVEVALKMAYQFWCHRQQPERTLFVGFEGGYHGDTFGAMAVGRDPLFFGRFEPLLFRTECMPVSASRLDELLARRGAEVAAVIIEPLVQGAGGMRMHTPEMLRDLFQVTRRHGVLFIADEVMTCGRTGTFWAHSQAGIAPELICAAKTLAGGVLPLAVTVASPEVVAAFDTDDRTQTFFHGHSFTAHPLACAVAVESLRLMRQTVSSADAERIGRFWRQAAATLGQFPGVQDVRVCGTILALDVNAPGGYLAEVGPRMRAAALENGVLLRPLGNVLYALPPLCTSDESLRRIAEAMRAAILAAGG
jgi:adenosylmethionine-8-amino-7-oxononanoate aminotransferase